MVAVSVMVAYHWKFELSKFDAVWHPLDVQVTPAVDGSVVSFMPSLWLP
jgi:hypothetical protein